MVNTWPCVVWLPIGLNTRSIDEFESGITADLPANATTQFDATESDLVYRFDLDADGEDKLRVRIGRFSQSEQVPIRCEFNGVGEIIHEM